MIFEKLKTIDTLLDKRIISLNLEYIHIKKFKFFEKNTKIEFKHPITVLIGKNGSGKSTFLKIIKSISVNKNPNDYFFETEWDKFDIYNKSEFHYRIDQNDYKEIKTDYFGWIFTPLQQKLESNKEIKKYLDNPSLKTFNKIIDIEFKHSIGAFEKNIFFDNQTTKIDLKYYNAPFFLDQ